jgi:FKBP-type peptidyl-prolyl cis-trans isomerase FklB
LFQGVNVRISKLLLVIGAFGGVAFAQTPAKPVPGGFRTSLEATSYAVGADMVRNFKAQDVSFDQAQLIQGIKDAAAGDKLLLNESEVKTLVSALESDVRTKMAAARKAEGEANLVKSEAFLQRNAAQPQVVTLGSGLQYKVKKAGQGPSPKDDSTVVANYKGMLMDGTIFDASQPGKPVSIALTQAIPGWREALKKMQIGSVWELVLPPNLAYGERGAGRVIGPNQALRFEIELLEIR